MRTRTYLIVAAAVLAAACGKDDGAADCVTEVGDDIREPTTWGEVCNTVHVTDSINILADLTIVEGTTVQLDQDVFLDVDDEGSMNAVGTSEDPIVFEGTTAEKGFWSGIAVETAKSENVMRHVVIRDAGGEGFKFNPWTLTVAGTSTSKGRLELSETTIENSAGLGLVIRDGGELVDSYRVTFRDVDGIPVQTAFEAAGAVHGTYEFEDVGEEYILITKGKLERDMQLTEMKVPYRFQRDAEIRGGGLFIGPGTTIELEQDVTLETNEGGTLAFRGSEDAPVTITGAEKVPGYWGGLVYESISEENVIQNVVLEYAGAPTWKGHQAGVIVAGNSTDRGFVEIRDSEIKDIDGVGVRIFEGGQADMQGVTFTNVSGTDVDDMNEQ